MESFRWLHASVSELKRLRGFWQPLNEARFCEKLEECQMRHQIAYGKCYGLPKMKPKHHHRTHLGQHSLKLQSIPLVEVHERKHQVLKSKGLVDRYEAFLTAPSLLQEALLPRMLEAMVPADQCAAMRDWVCAVPGEVLSDLEERKSLELNQWKFRQEELLLFQREAEAGIIRKMYSSQNGKPVLYLQRLKLIKRTHWGSIWSLEETRFIWAPQKEDVVFRPSWWALRAQKCLALH